MLLGKLIVIAYFAILVLLSFYGGHRYLVLYLYYRNKNRRPRPKGKFSPLPMVTVQIPLYNERYVAARVIEAVCNLNYPRQKLEIQVLDDSTDDTTRIVQQKVQQMRAEGHSIYCIHRQHREGFKAGALENGLKRARGEFIAIFDADFIPPPDFLIRTIHYFTDPTVGMVQARWEHVNRNYSILTQVESILLDGHFVLEHAARNFSGRFFNFNGTAGIWRKETILQSGGWQHDTLTEDLDLSYRAQLAGWKFVFVPELTAGSELPVEMNAFKSQQHRWAKGAIQTGLKMLPRIWKAKLPLATKIEATFHLTGNLAYLLMLFLALLLPPAVVIRGQIGWHDLYYLDIIVFIAATISICCFYICSQMEVSRSPRDWLGRLFYIPLLLSVGIGLSVNNARAVLEALLGHGSEFVRTPKYDIKARKQAIKGKRYRIRINSGVLFELVLGIYFCLNVYLAWQYEMYISIPFLALFPIGYLYVSILSIVHAFSATRPQRKLAMT
jgi:cellulose synthase/poly-beta-1,6-N-acetylglucosamine synthase-like glycosyltransferase